MEQLTTWREERKMTKAALQYETRVDSSQISRYEHSHDMPSLVTLSKLLAALEAKRPIPAEEVKALILSAASEGPLTQMLRFLTTPTAA